MRRCQRGKASRFGAGLAPAVINTGRRGRGKGARDPPQAVLAIPATWLV